MFSHFCNPFVMCNKREENGLIKVPARSGLETAHFFSS